MNGDFYTEILTQLDWDILAMKSELIHEDALRKFKGLCFIPRKLQLQPIYNRKPLNTSIRNNLPQRIRVNEQAES